MENLSIDIATRVQWSSWSRCESSFSMLLVPHRPGIFALAEEVADGQQASGIFRPAPEAGAPKEPASRPGPPLPQAHKKLASYANRPVFPAGF